MLQSHRMDRLRQYLGESFPVLDAMVRITRRVCTTNVRRFEPRLGDDAFVLGSMNWRNLLAAYEAELPPVVTGLRVTRPNNHMLISLENGMRISPYSTHPGEGEPSFRSDSKAKAMLSSRNAISFFEFASSFAPSDFPSIRDLVVLYDADAYQGLRAMYGGAPLSVGPHSNDDASGWFFCETIYRRPDGSDEPDSADESPLEPTPPTRPFSEREIPEVPIEPREDEPSRRIDMRSTTDTIE